MVIRICFIDTVFMRCKQIQFSCKNIYLKSFANGSIQGGNDGISSIGFEPIIIGKKSSGSE